MAHNASVSDFLQYVRRRRLKMVVCGLVIIALGTVVIALHPQSTDLNILMGGLILFGVGLSLSGSAVSYKLLREVRALVNSDGRTLELFTYPYRGGARSLRNDRVLATLDEIGSHERVPLIEFKAIWFTPGIGEASSGPVKVFGGLEMHQAVLAFGEHGGVLGRVSKIRINEV